LTKDKVVATALKVMEATRIRVGNVCYAEENHSYGLTTLLDRHVKIRRGKVELHFRGKGGIRRRTSIADQRLAALVRQCRDVPGPRLFQYLDAQGERHPVASGDINRYIRLAMGRFSSAKELRTWAATVIAARLLFSSEVPSSKAQAKHTLRRVVTEVAERLGHTPAICRKSYVHPDIVEAFVDGELHRRFGACLREVRRSGPKGLSSHEAAVLRLLVRSRRQRSAA
jgi:DNA topoisomerase-1